MASQAPDIDDPSNWVQAQDPASGRDYWINKTTNETSWNPPQLVSTEGDGPNWEEAQDPSTGRAYYVNTVTRRATWSRPELNTLSAASSERFFRYIDKRGKEQGPFPESKLQEWFADGYFKTEVKCREETETGWSTIGKYFGDEDANEEEEKVSSLGGQRRGSMIVGQNDEPVESKVSTLKVRFCFFFFGLVLVLVSCGGFF